MQRITSQQGREIIKSVRGVVFDLAGTLIDTGCQAPVHAMTAAFAKNGLIVTDKIVREDMGLPKRAHIMAILDKPAMKTQWECLFNNQPRKVDVDRIYQSTNQELKRVVANYSKPTPFAIELLYYLQANGIHIGITTGYSREIINVLGDQLHKSGIIYNNLVCADEVKNPRPKAGMINKIFDDWEIYNFGHHRFIKIGDTIADIQEAHAAGITCCQVIDTCSDLGNIINTDNKINNNNREFINNERNSIKHKFAKSGADFYCNNLHDILVAFKNI